MNEDPLMDQLHTLHLEQPAADALTCALLQAIDDLEARAIIAEHHDPILGPISAAEYRTDVQRLRIVLGAIAPGSRAPSPDRTAVHWIDGTWTVSNGHPVRLHRQDDLEGLLESSLDLVHYRLLDPHDALTAIHDLIANDDLHIATTNDLIHRNDIDHHDDIDLIDHDHDYDHDDQTQISNDQTTHDLQTSSLPTLQAAHRFARRGHRHPLAALTDRRDEPLRRSGRPRRVLALGRRRHLADTHQVGVRRRCHDNGHRGTHARHLGPRQRRQRRLRRPGCALRPLHPLRRAVHGLLLHVQAHVRRPARRRVPGHRDDRVDRVLDRHRRPGWRAIAGHVHLVTGGRARVRDAGAQPVSTKGDGVATTTDIRGNGSTRTEPERLRLDPNARVGRRPRTSWIALGLLVLVGFGLFGAITVARVAGREPVLALAQPIQRGEQLTAAHLAVVNVGTDDAVALVPAADRDDLLGLTATAGLEAGTLVTRTQFAEGPTVVAGFSVVGLSLSPGEYPTATLRPGDLVVVVRTPATTPLEREDNEPVVLVEAAEVFAIETLSETAHTVMVSIVVPDNVVPEIAAAAAAGRVRLALVGGS